MQEGIPQRIRPRDFSWTAGFTREAVSIFRQSPGAVLRKYAPWEAIPPVKKIVRENIERVGQNALRSFHDKLLLDAQIVNNPGVTDPERIKALSDREAYKEIFGKDPLALEATPYTPSFSNVHYLNKGWNSFVLSFTTTPNGTNEEKQWIVKIGYDKSPDKEFFLNPSDKRLVGEIEQNIKYVEEATKDGTEEEIRLGIVPRTRDEREAAGNFDLPHLLPSLRVTKLVKYNNYRDKEVERTVVVVPFEEIVPLNEVRSSVVSDDFLGHNLQEEYRRFCALRLWLIDNHQIDVDFTGADNVVVVRERNAKLGEQQLHIRLLDLGLRDHKKNAPIGHSQFDHFSTKHGLNLRQAIHGRFEKENNNQDKTAEYDIVVRGKTIRRQRRVLLFAQWASQRIDRFRR